MKQLFNKIFITCVAIFLIATAAWGLLTAEPLRIPSPGVVYDMPKGASLKTVAKTLKQHEVIKNTLLFELYVRLHGDTRKLKAGEYYFPQGATVVDVVKKLTTGDVIKHFFRVQEGSTHRDLIKQLEATHNIKHTINIEHMTWFENITPGYTHPEGLFMPDTYQYTKNETDAALLKRMFNSNQAYLMQAWETRDIKTPYQSPYEALIVASIVEKEAALPSEREEIAGVIIRRLANNMRLQMDPTVIYGMGESFNGNITKADLRRDTPYNTYVHNGLPPSPIALPSRQSIDAAMHPKPGDTLYFVSKGDGSHYFSATLEEHNAAVKRYIIKSQ